MTCTRVSDVPENTVPLPDFTRWPSFPFEGDMRVKRLAPPVDVEPKRSGEDAADCVACNTPDDAYIWVDERWRVRAMDRPTGLPVVLILECRSHLDLGDLTNLLAAELGVMTVRLERAIRSLDGVARVHVNRWGDGSAHLHMWFLARPYGRLQLRGTFLSLWDDILPVMPESQWRENLALVAAWLADFGGNAIAEPPHIQWQAPSSFNESPTAQEDAGPHAGQGQTGYDSTARKEATDPPALGWRPTDLGDVEELGVNARESGHLPTDRTEVGTASADMMAFENARTRVTSEAPEHGAFDNDGSVSPGGDAGRSSGGLSGTHTSGRPNRADGGPIGGTGTRATADTARP